MKRGFLLCAIIAMTIGLIACANQPNTAANDNSRKGLVGAGSVAPVSGGPATPGHIPQRFEP